MFLFLRFRCLQAYRSLRDAGFLLLGCAVLLTAGLWVNLLLDILNLPLYAICLASLFSGLSIHSYRSDRAFLQKRDTVLWKSLLSDYFLFGLLLALPYLLTGRWLSACASFTALLCAALPLRKSYGSKNDTAIPINLPLQYMEWQSLFRQRWVYLLVLVVLQIACFFHISFLGIFLLMVVGILPEAFKANESRALVPKDWPSLLKKNRILSTALLVFSFPVFVLSLNNGVTWWPLLLYGFFAIFTVFQLVFWYKYANWSPFRAQNNNTNIAMLSFFSVLLPGFILIGIALALRYFLKAKRAFKLHYAS